MKFRQVLLIVALVLAGAVIYAIQTDQWDLRFGWNEEFPFSGREYVFEESQTIPPPFPLFLELVNAHGGVDIEAADQDGITLTLTKRIWRKNETLAKDIADRLKAVVVREGDRVRISTNREEFEKRPFETHFELRVPRGLDVDVRTSYGPVRIAGTRRTAVDNRHGRVVALKIEGPLTIYTNYEDVTVEDAQAGCQATLHHADLRLLRVAGDANIQHSYGVVHIEDVTQKAVVKGSHSEVALLRVGGEVEVETSYESVLLEETGPARVNGNHADVRARSVSGLTVVDRYARVDALNIQGDLSVEGKNIAVKAEQVRGREVRVLTSYEDVELVDFAGRTTVNLSHGDLILAPASLAAPLEVRSDYSAVELRWPSGERNPLEAQTRGGNIHWELPFPPALNQTNGTSFLKAFSEASDRPPVVIVTSYGDIRVVEKAKTL
ncbi:MAG: DUF4097 domain-containing protein [Candidatus Aminicenantes bacterium]|nr:DUF4097 domain-containing protein [Candidatus Aminicenantes bacterium]